MTRTCSYDCNSYPKDYKPNPDITGIGINFSYIITASLALLLVVANYLVAFDPDIDPFDKKDRPKTRFRPNPIDKYLLCWRLGARSHNNIISRITHASTKRIRDAFTQCMLIMSDFQLLTGLSVLISGYTQLRCGIFIYHWEKIIDLAWFSAITHLCCLTFLRNHFCRDKIAQVWRIPCMIALVVMLTVALVPSSRYLPGTATGEYVMDHDFAICFFKTRSDAGISALRKTYYSTFVRGKTERVTISGVLLIFGMLTRLWRLYETPTNWYLDTRMWLSQHTRKWLKRDRDNGTPKVRHSALFVIFVQRLLLAVFLFFRLLTDALASKALEVWWLAIGLTWGFLRLYPTGRKISAYYVKPSDEALGSDDHEWTFGQVMALLILVAPVLDLGETYLTTLYKKKSDLEATTPKSPLSMRPPVPGQRSAPLHEGICTIDDPDFDFYGQSDSFATLVYGLLVLAVWTSIHIVRRLFEYDISQITRLFDPNPVGPYLLVYIGCILMCILISLTVSQHEPMSKLGRLVTRAVLFTLCVLVYLPATLTMTYRGDLSLSLTLVGYTVIYLVLSAAEFHLKGHPSALVSSPVSSTDGTMLASDISRSISTTVDPSVSSSDANAQRPFSQLHISQTFNVPRRQDTEARIGVDSPMRRRTYFK